MPDPATIPTGEHELAGYMLEHLGKRDDPHSSLDDLERDLAEQLGNTHTAGCLILAAGVHYDHAQAVDRKREVLRRALLAAQAQLDTASRAVGALNGPLYDVEYAEGVGSDVLAFLADAARMVRAAEALTARAEG